MSDFMWFDQVHNRYHIQAQMSARTGFRIGRGKESTATLTDLPILTTAGERVLLPGSSWKGVIRSGAERLLRSLNSPEGAEGACDLFHKACLDESWAPKESSSTADKIQARRSYIEERICRACNTFGAPGMASRVKTADCVLEHADVRVRDGVAMSRDRARAEDGLKYNFEVVSPGAVLTLNVHLENVEPWQVGLVLAMLDDISDGHQRIGGFGSRGLGWLQIDRITLTRQSLSDILARREGQRWVEDAETEGEPLAEFHTALSTLWES